MNYYAIIDTNVIVSSFITHNDESPTVSIIKLMMNKKIVPIFSSYLIDEYRTVLTRPEFGLTAEMIDLFILSIITNGLQIEPSKTNVVLPDVKDKPIYEISLDTRELNSYLVTGNIKHFPKKSFIVTPKQMLEIIDKQEQK